MSSQVEDGVMTAISTREHHDREKSPPPYRTYSNGLASYVYSIYLRCDAGVLRRSGGPAGIAARRPNVEDGRAERPRRIPYLRDPGGAPLHPSSTSSARSSSSCHASKSVHT